MKKYPFLIALAVIIAFALTSCNEVIQVDLPEATPQLSVDGWLYNNTSRQEIKLTTTTSYFDSLPQPAVTNAQLYITDLTAFQQYKLTQEPGNPGIYVHNSLTPIIGHKYQLDIYHEFEHYVALDQVNRVPSIDSLQFIPRSADIFRKESTWELTLWARDLPGAGDYYKFNVIRNRILKNNASQINIADDKSADGLIFIPPISRRLNVESFKANVDTITVRILSLSVQGYAFWATVQNALNNRGLFARPANNILSNIINVNPDSPVKAVGFFGCSAVSTRTRVVGQKQK